MTDADLSTTQEQTAEDATVLAISEAASAAALAEATGTDNDMISDAATAAALSVVKASESEDMDLLHEHDPQQQQISADDDAANRRNEQRRKRYRERGVEEKVHDDQQVDNDVEGGLGVVDVNAMIEEDKMGQLNNNHTTTSVGGGAQGLGPKKSNNTHEALLAARRLKDRQRYANMTPDQRQVYNSKRREQYHRQSDTSRQKRRERERARYHSLDNDASKDRNTRRARLERERYQKLSPEELEAKNRKRRERAASARAKKEAAAGGTAPPPVAAAPLLPDTGLKESDVQAVVEAAAVEAVASLEAAGVVPKVEVESVAI